RCYGDFNEVGSADERMGSVFNVQGAIEFNDFISNSGLVDIQLEGYSFTWSRPSASKMNRHLSDHRPILLRDVIADYGATPFHDRNGMVRFQKKLQALKKEIRMWVADHKWKQTGRRNEIKHKLIDVDKQLDQGGVSDDILLSRMDLMKQLQDIKSSDAHDFLQKAKIRWSIEGDENFKFFHGIINRKRANLAIRGVMVDKEWVDDPSCVKEEFHHVVELEKPITRDEIRNAVWACGENKSPGPDGFTFEFFRKFWVLISKAHDPKFVSEYRPISLIGCLYKVVTKILAIRLSSVIADLISDVQTAFLPNRQILDGPFIINELLSWCKHKKQQATIFKVDFAKAYDSIRWDFLDDVLQSFGFGSKWRYWILGSLSSGMASILVKGSPTSEFQFHCGLKQGDPLAPYLYILVMESLHLSFSRVVDAGIFKGIKIDNSITISHLFYADDTVFVGVGTSNDKIIAAASNLGCSVMKTPFKYLGVIVGVNMSNEFFNGAQGNEKKITWVKWSKMLSAKKHAMHDSNIHKLSSFTSSTWNAIIREISVLKSRGVDLISHCKKRVGNEILKRFWNDVWIGDQQLRYLFPRIYALDEDKDCSVAVKLQGAVDLSLHRHVRGGAESQQLAHLQELIGSTILANTKDRWNQLLFAAQKPRKDVIFDDIVVRSFSWCSARFEFYEYLSDPDTKRNARDPIGSHGRIYERGGDMVA
nr:RNA-directed DNA polymerase, eukaryota [Tanacetum cinerariifolium]